MKEEYLIPNLENGKFFCYLGCFRLWESKYGVMKHYVDHHNLDEGRDNLCRWGLDYETLELQVNAMA